ncbi:glycosyltransferase [Planomonospora sp. ID82291]|uniref:glycosyltransferase family 2 protein n=1 Tax=Planomonospora sp. ID82291 TaxID=2738136 RepID=UPI0018C3B564|nr:glycosyltransferase [Planomonospora sp. ID82291]MBG0813532.1 glycosyltransferase [Planomonospora sp. ID82291]
MKTPLLSVVVPFFEVEEYLRECLTSLAEQTLTDLEVVMVDDGSTDGSAVIAKEFAAADRRFRLVQQENRGLGPARNTGVGHARGAYLAFADSDDVLPAGAYAAMVGSLERSGSDFASGAVHRFTAEESAPSGLHRRMFRRTVHGTHISRKTNLVHDRTAWNKVYRRSFWDRHGFAFPEGLYEDAPVTIPAHVLASSVDVLADVVYHWRLRPTSITQRRTEVTNVRDRIASVRAVQGFVAERAPSLRRVLDQMIASWDLRLAGEAIAVAAEEDLDALFAIVDPCLAALDPAAVAELPVVRRLELHLLRHRMVAELREVCRFRQEEEVRVVRRGLCGRRWYAAYPFFRDRSRGIPDRVYEVGDELALRAVAEEARWSEGRLLLEGRAGIRHLEEQPGEVRLWLAGPGARGRVPVRVEQGEGGGFAAEIALEDLPPGRWTLHGQVSLGRLRREGPVRGPLTAEGEPGEQAGRDVRYTLGKGGRLILEVP